MSPNRAARRSRPKRVWRREAQRAADRAAELHRKGFRTETIAATLHLSPALVSMMIEDAGAHSEQEQQEAKAS